MVSLRRRVLANSPHKATASGSIATFQTAVAMPMKVTGQIVPVQDLHGQTNPYPAGGGTNKYDVSANPIEQGSISSANGQDTSSDTRIRTNGYIPVKASTTYILSASGTATYFYTHYYNSEQSHVGSGSGWQTNGSVFTTPSTAAYLRVVYSNSNNTNVVPSDVSNIMLNEGLTALPYAPYENICPITGWTGANVFQAPKNLLPKTLPSDAFAGNFGTNSTTISSASNARCFSFYIGKNVALRYYRTSSTAVGVAIAFADTKLTSRTGATIYNAVNMTNRADYGMNSGEHPYVVVNCSSVSNYNDLIDSYGVTLIKNTETKQYTNRLDWYSFTKSITWQDEAGTVYGGYYTINEDGSVDLVSTLKAFVYSNVSLYGNYQGHPLYYADISDYSTEPIKKMANSAQAGILLCDRLTKITKKLTSEMLNLQIRTESDTAPSRFYFRYDEVADLATLNAELATNPMTVVAELQTPLTYHLANIGQLKSLKGINNIWSDTGDVSVEYWKL